MRAAVLNAGRPLKTHLRPLAAAECIETSEESPFSITVNDTTKSTNLYLFVDGQNNKDVTYGNKITFEAQDPLSTTKQSTCLKLGLSNAPSTDGQVVRIDAKIGDQIIASGFVKLAYRPATDIICSDQTIPVGSSISFSKIMSIAPENSTSSFSYVSNDTNILQGFFGSFTAKAVGQTTVTITSKDFAPVTKTVSITVTDDYPVFIGDQGYASLEAAIAAVPNNNVDPVTIAVKSAPNSFYNGILVSDNKNIVIDFNNNTYAVQPNVGSSGTPTQCVHVDSGSKVVFKNGTLKGYSTMTSYAYRMFMQNYGDVTFENMVVDGSIFTNQENIVNFNSGNSNIVDSQIILPEKGNLTVNLGGNDSWFVDGAKLKIDGEETSIDSIKTINGVNEGKDALLEIKDGTIEKVFFEGSSPKLISISGGCYNDDVTAYCLKEDGMPIKVAAKDDDGKYVVINVNEIAAFKIGEAPDSVPQYYKSLDAAIDDLEDGDAISVRAAGGNTEINTDKNVTVTNDTGKEITVNGIPVSAGKEINSKEAAKQSSDEKNLAAAKKDALDKLAAIDTSKYVDPELSNVKKAIEDAKKAIAEAKSADAVKSALDAAKATVSAQAIYDTKLPKVKAKASKKLTKAGFRARWKRLSRKNRKKVDGIQIQYADDKGFTVNARFKNAKKKWASRSVKNLTSKKTYYARMRTYKTVNGVKYVGKWSKVKKVRTK